MAYSFVDRILECEPGRSVRAIKALALNEEFFRDHFPGMPVLPGAMLLEGFVQAARRCLVAIPGGHDRWEVRSVGRMRFNRFAEPGDVVEFDVVREEEPADAGEEQGLAWFSGRARIDGQGICRVRFGLQELPSP